MVEGREWGESGGVIVRLARPLQHCAAQPQLEARVSRAAVDGREGDESSVEECAELHPSEWRDGPHRVSARLGGGGERERERGGDALGALRP